MLVVNQEKERTKITLLSDINNDITILSDITEKIKILINCIDNAAADLPSGDDRRMKGCCERALENNMFSALNLLKLSLDYTRQLDVMEWIPDE